MIVDANLLLYAVDSRSPFHSAAAAFLTGRLNGATRIGLPWPSLCAFLRLVTNPRVVGQPLAPATAWRVVEDWLDADPVWIPTPTARHAEVLGGLITRHHLGGGVIHDAHLAALAIEHGVPVVSADTDFARFPEVVWINPLGT